MVRKIWKNFIFAIFLTFILLLPNFLANLWWENYYLFSSKNSPKEVGITFLISLLISFAPRRQQLFWIAFFLLLNFVQLGYFGYFHTYLPPFQLDLLFTQLEDILDSAQSILGLILLLGVGFVGVLLLLHYLTRKLKLSTLPYISLFLLFLLILFPFFIAKKRAVYFPNGVHLGYLNTLFAVDLWIINKLTPRKKTHYKPYIVEKVGGGKKIVVVIMGESLNFKRMHLFGWEVNNTPNLDKLKNDPHFFYKPAISGGVNTPVSIVTFFNLKREPQNLSLLLSQKTNLLKLAKENNYTTYWLSMQEEGTSISTLLNFADFKKTRKDFKEKYDDGLVKELKKIPTIDGKRKFIIIHLRADHSPYEEYTPPSFYRWKFNFDNYHKYKIYSYYDSVLYVDHTLFQIINYIRHHFKEYAIYFTSDHGEMLGFPEEGGRYGHSQLVWGDTFVPFLYYSDNPRELNRTIYNHYQIGKMVAEDLGYKIINPNEDGTFFVNGVQIDGSAGFIHYRFNSKGETNPIKVKEKR
jgi:glucan phosphoethanolaminetransferase (alkaline phosphatase superfamily)